MQWKEKNRKSTNKHLAHSLEKAEKYELPRFKIESIWHFCSFDKHDGTKLRIFVSLNMVHRSNECKCYLPFEEYKQTSLYFEISILLIWGLFY